MLTAKLYSRDRGPGGLFFYVGGPIADDEEGWVDYPLITFEPGDTVGALANYFPTPDSLQGQG
ncbi:MAG: hypothetical protein Ct9H300mP9_0910 [Candidatus Neomarinimicrobiota bacterium]|nr:MAG: hypothetical protein Ct9H300mP9_0910 [Candidatus Neomarinimicrobiota bacterium]